MESTWMFVLTHVSEHIRISERLEVDSYDSLWDTRVLYYSGRCDEKRASNSDANNLDNLGTLSEIDSGTCKNQDVLF